MPGDPHHQSGTSTSTGAGTSESDRLSRHGLPSLSRRRNPGPQNRHIYGCDGLQSCCCRHHPPPIFGSSRAVAAQEQISTCVNPSPVGSTSFPFAIDPLCPHSLPGWHWHWRMRAALTPIARAEHTLSTRLPNSHPWRVAIDFACFRPTRVTSSLRPEGLERGGEGPLLHHRQDHSLPLAHAFETPEPCPPNSADCHLHSILLGLLLGTLLCAAQGTDGQDPLLSHPPPPGSVLPFLPSNLPPQPQGSAAARQQEKQDLR